MSFFFSSLAATDGGGKRLFWILLLTVVVAVVAIFLCPRSDVGGRNEIQDNPDAAWCHQNNNNNNNNNNDDKRQRRSPPPLPPILPSNGPYPIRQRAVLPGLDDTQPQRHAYYAGYLDAGIPPSGKGTLYLHYICAMVTPPSSTSNDDDEAWKDYPMTIWYNGGPGAPSTFGLFQEFGPYLLTSESLATQSYRQTGIPEPIYNPWSWASQNLTNICEIDSPGPMGASFCTQGNGTNGSTGGPSGDPYSCGPWTDHTVAAANHRAYQSFFRHAFPSYETTQQPVFIVGESYAGVYVPLIVDEWLRQPITGPTGRKIHLAGLAVGDGFPACAAPAHDAAGKPAVGWCANLTNVGFFQYPNALPGPYWDVEFFHGHSQMSETLYHKIRTTCTMEELMGRTMPLSPTCQTLIQQMSQEVGLFHVYNLLEACPAEAENTANATTYKHGGTNLRTTTTAAAEPRNGNDTTRKGDGTVQDVTTTTTTTAVLHPRRMLAGNYHRNMPSHRRTTTTAAASSPGDGDTGLGAPCLSNSMDLYFALPSVQQGLGIPLDNNFIVLDNGIGFNYTTTASFVGPIYKRAVEAGLRVLLYEGDTDACGLQTAPIEDVWVPYFGQSDDDDNGKAGDEGPWTPMGRLTGEAAPLNLPQTGPWRPFAVRPGVQGGYVVEWLDGQVRFVSIRGAGHLAPLYRPAASFTMFEAFVKGSKLTPIM